MDSIEPDLNRLESALENVLMTFNSSCSLQIKTKNQLDTQCTRRENHHKSEHYRPSKMKQSNRSEDMKIRTTEDPLGPIQVESQLKLKKKVKRRNIRVSDNCISREQRSCSSSVSSKVGSIKGILKRGTFDSSVGSRASSSSGKSVKFNLQTGSLRNQLNQWK